MAKLHAVTSEKVVNMVMCFYNCHRWSFSQILTQMIAIIFCSYMGPCLSPIKYDPMQDYYLKGLHGL